MKRIEPIIILLTGLLVFFTGTLIVCEWIFASDKVLFAVFSGLLSNVSGALFMGIKSQLGIPDTPPPGTKTTIQATSESTEVKP